MGKLINTEKLEELIELAILSGRVRGADPVSLLISAKIGTGKTAIVKQYREVPTCKYVTETTAFGIQQKYLPLIESGQIRHLIIGDLVNPLSKQKSTRETFIAFMNCLIEDGLKAIATYYMRWESKEPIKCGMITTIAQPDLLYAAGRWYEIGFLSRCVPVTYSYSPSTKMRIHQEIAEGEDMYEPPPKYVWVPPVFCPVKPNKEINVSLIELVCKFEEAEKVYGFRRQKQIQTLLMANALKNRRLHVTQEDADTIMELCNYINLDFKEI